MGRGSNRDGGRRAMPTGSARSLIGRGCRDHKLRRGEGRGRSAHSTGHLHVPGEASEEGTDDAQISCQTAAQSIA